MIVNRLKPYLKPYLKETILAPLLKLFEAILELLVPLIMAVIIDKGIENQDTSLILGQGAILIVLGILGVVVSITAQYYAAKAATGFTADLRQALFSKIQYFSFSQLDALHFTDTFDERYESRAKRIKHRASSVAAFTFYRRWSDCDGLCCECGNGMDVCHHSSNLSSRRIRDNLLDNSNASPGSRATRSYYASGS